MTRRSDRALLAVSLLLLITVGVAGLFAHQLARRREPPQETVEAHVCPDPLWAGWNLLCGCGPYVRKDRWSFHGW